MDFVYSRRSGEQGVCCGCFRLSCIKVDVDLDLEVTSRCSLETSDPIVCVFCVYIYSVGVSLVSEFEKVRVGLCLYVLFFCFCFYFCESV